MSRKKPDPLKRFGKATARVEKWRARSRQAEEKAASAQTGRAAAFWSRELRKAIRLQTRAEQDRKAWSEAEARAHKRRELDRLRRKATRGEPLTPDERFTARELVRKPIPRPVRPAHAIELAILYRRRRGGSVDFSVRIMRSDEGRITYEEARTVVRELQASGAPPPDYTVEGVSWRGRGGQTRTGDDLAPFQAIIAKLTGQELDRSTHLRAGMVEEEGEE